MTRLKIMLSVAIAAAKKSNEQFKHGAVLFSGHRVFGIGFNQNRMIGWAIKSFNLRNTTKDVSMHAEMSCMHNIDRGVIKGKDMIVVRVHANGKLAYSKPCKVCQKILKEKGIRRVYFSTNEGTLRKLK